MRRVSSPAQLEHWTKTVNDLEEFYKEYPLPSGPVKISKCETIVDVKLFVSSHLSIVRAQFGKPTYGPYVYRLIKLKNILTTKNQLAA